jgi:phosphoribosyl 1,2-cyclic phosphodiesterase
VRLSILGSGSSGNCTYVETEKCRLLVDAGFGIRSLRRRLKDAGLEPEGIDAILITHGHTDHVKGVEGLSRQFGAQVYASEGTRDEAYSLQEIDGVRTFKGGDCLEIGDVEVRTFPIPHDSAEAVGFRLSNGGVAGLLATDLGCITEAVEYNARGCDWLVLESNHDEELLKLGPYPWHLKRRVLSDQGHLSNSCLADFLTEGFDGSASHLFLAHLSRQNNAPELALDSARWAIQQRSPQLPGRDLRIHLTHQTKPSIVLSL